MNWRDKRVVVTGAGAGIGREFARQLHKKGAHVVAVSLVKAELDALTKELPNSTAIAVDLTMNDAVDQMMQSISERGLRIDALINNAGMGLFGEHVGLAPHKVEAMLQLNVVAFTRVFTAVAAHMTANGKGAILNVASTTAFQPLPYLAAYAASKHYVLAFSEAVAQELAPQGIHVTTLCPGTTRTAFLEGCGLDVKHAAKGSLSALADKVAMSPRDVAAKGISALERKEGVVVPGLLNQAHRLLAAGVTDRWAGRVASQLFQSHLTK